MTWGPNASTPVPSDATPPGSVAVWPETVVELVENDFTHVGWFGYAHDLEWADEYNGSYITGDGSLVLQHDDPKRDDLTLLRRLRFWFRGVNVITVLIDPAGSPADERKVDQGEERGQTASTGGPGTLGLLNRGTVPPLDPNRNPAQQTVHYNPGHPRYDDSFWPDTSVVVDDPQYAGTEDFPIPIPLYDSGDGDPVEWANNPDPMWGPDGESDPYPEEVCHFRKTEDFGNTTTVSGKLRIAINNEGSVWFDGDLVMDLDGAWNFGNFRQVHEVDIDVTPGEHTLYIRARNIVGNIEDADDAGKVFSRLRLYSTAGAALGNMFESGTGWTVLEDPATEPGWTWTAVLRDLIAILADEDANAPQIDPQFTDAQDSASEDMPVLPDIAVQVGSTIHQVALQAAEAFLDLRMDPTVDELSAWLKDTSGAHTGYELEDGSTDPLSCIESLHHRVTPPLATAVRVQYAAGWFTVEDSAAVAAHGYRSVHLNLSQYRSREMAEEIADQFLALYSSERVAYDVTIHPRFVNDNPADGPIVGQQPWVDWSPGDYISLPGRDGTLTEVRVQSIRSTVDDDGLVHHDVTAGDLIYDDETRLQNWLARLADGAVGGRTHQATSWRSLDLTTKVPPAPQNDETSLPIIVTDGTVETYLNMTSPTALFEVQGEEVISGSDLGVFLLRGLVNSDHATWLLQVVKQDTGGTSALQIIAEAAGGTDLAGEVRLDAAVLALAEIADPDAPAAGDAYLYARAGQELVWKNPSGDEAVLRGIGAGERLLRYTDTASPLTLTSNTTTVISETLMDFEDEGITGLTWSDTDNRWDATEDMLVEIAAYLDVDSSGKAAGSGHFHAVLLVRDTATSTVEFPSPATPYGSGIDFSCPLSATVFIESGGFIQISARSSGTGVNIDYAQTLIRRIA